MLELFRIVQRKQLPTFESIEHSSLNTSEASVASISIWHVITQGLLQETLVDGLYLSSIEKAAAL